MPPTKINPPSDPETDTCVPNIDKRPIRIPDEQPEPVVFPQQEPIEAPDIFHPERVSIGE